MRNLKPLSFFLFFFTLACETISLKTHSIESGRVTGPENILFAGASFSPENLQAGAVKGLTIKDSETDSLRGLISSTVGQTGKAAD